MLVNEDLIQPVCHVEFIEYTGRYPNLCSGALTLKVEGRLYIFGDRKDAEYPRFWRTDSSLMSCCDKGEWEIDVRELPEEIQKYAPEIDKVFNANVEHGHCGGCR